MLNENVDYGIFFERLFANGDDDYAIQIPRVPRRHYTHTSEKQDFCKKFHLPLYLEKNMDGDGSPIVKNILLIMKNPQTMLGTFEDI